MMQWLNKFPSAKQFDEMDCGPTCLQIIGRYYDSDRCICYAALGINLYFLNIYVCDCSCYYGTKTSVACAQPLEP